jgi:dsDNA-specific endonuclease/ATPase MutS2
MDFEEKMDAIRMNLELAFHDIEAQRASIEAQRASIEAQRASIEAQRASIEAQRASIEAIGVKIDSLRAASASQYESIQVLMKSSGDLLATAQSHERRIQGLERRA